MNSDGTVGKSPTTATLYTRSYDSEDIGLQTIDNLNSEDYAKWAYIDCGSIAGAHYIKTREDAKNWQNLFSLITDSYKDHFGGHIKALKYWKASAEGDRKI